MKVGLILAVACWQAMAGPATGSFIGPTACAACHRSHVERQAQTNHALALRPVQQSALAHLLTDRPVRDAQGTQYEYTAGPDGLQVQLTRTGGTLTERLLWAFGAGSLAITPVGQQQGRWVEHRVSWYNAPQRPGMTLGHPAKPQTSLAAAFGQPQSAESIYRCFNCHAAGVQRGPDLTAMQPGVQCERCHGPGQAHAAEPRRIHLAVPSSATSLASAQASVAFCAQCHRMPDPRKPNRAPEQDDPVSIRFAPVGLLASSCFQRSGIMTCLTCHDPHENASREAASYSHVCQSCHPAASARVRRCPQPASSDCLSCHMRKATPVPDLTFTDHRIRIYPAPQ